MFGPYVPASGPSPARIMVVGEAPGEEESRLLRPFVGVSGRELRAQLTITGIDPESVRFTNVFSHRPPDNSLAAFGTSERLDSPIALPLTTNPTTYIRREWLGELDRLRGEVAACNPNIIIALGNTACWALLGKSGIGNLRGVLYPSTLPDTRSYKILPTYHPAAVLRQWPLRVVALSDLEKARNESYHPDIVYDNAELWLEPSYADLLEFGRTRLEHSTIISTDVETKAGQITCLGFGDDTGARAIVVPFWKTSIRADSGNAPHYWPTIRDERLAWRWCARWIEGRWPKVLQNGVYDYQYMVAHGLKPRNFLHDTMLAHHSKFCELQKGLGFLGSIYQNVPNWKAMHRWRAEDVIKSDD